MVQVGEDRKKRKAISDRPAQLTRCPVLYRPAVRQSGQGISECELLQQYVLGLELPMEFDNPAPHTHTGEELIGMEWLRQVVIGTGCQPLHKLVLLSDSGEDNEIGIGFSRMVPDVLAELYSGQVRHHPVRDYQGRLMFGKKINGFLTVFSKQHGVLLFR